MGRGMIQKISFVCLLLIFLTGCTIKQDFSEGHILSIEYDLSSSDRTKIDKEKRGEKLESVECPTFMSQQLDLLIAQNEVHDISADNPYSYYVWGFVSDSHSNVTINKKAIIPVMTEGEDEGRFNYNFYVDNGKITICIVAISPEGEKVSWNQTLVVDGDLLKASCEEKLTKTDPLNADSDEDSILDHDEDFDNDELSNFWECRSGTDPFNSDTDGDGLLDGEEVFDIVTDPASNDTDGDGIFDNIEIKQGTDPWKKN